MALDYPLQWDPVQVTYLDVSRLIDNIVRKFYQHYGRRWVTENVGQYDEVRTTADDFFLKAYNTYDPTLGEFNGWMYDKVWKGLLSMLRNGLRRRRKLTEVEWEELQARSSPVFDLADFISNLPEDAAEVVRLVCVDTPSDIYLTLAMNRMRGETPPAFREALRQYLKDVGWAAKQISQAFKDVQEALYQ